VKRGEIWTVAGGGAYASKPRPFVVIQDDRYDATESVTLCGFTSVGIDAPVSRPLIEPTETNGLRVASHLMVDKITTVPKHRLGRRLGMLAPADVQRLNRAILVFLGLV
jgi:mRNA interferase MazF